MPFRIAAVVLILIAVTALGIWQFVIKVEIPELERAAQQQERETDTRINSLMAMFEPLLIIVMGAMVLLIVLSILLPIFELNLLVA